jgi:hypothetical protein
MKNSRGELEPESLEGLSVTERVEEDQLQEAASLFEARAGHGDYIIEDAAETLCLRAEE